MFTYKCLPDSYLCPQCLQGWIAERWLLGNMSFFYVTDLIVSFIQKLECPKVKGQLLIFGATNWDLIGRKEVPKQQGKIFL